MAVQAQVREALLVHYQPARRAEIGAMCAEAGSWIRPAVAGLTVSVSPTQTSEVAAG